MSKDAEGEGTYGATNVQSLVTSGSAVTGVQIGRQNTANDVAKMGQVVGVRERAGDQDVALALDRKDGLGGVCHFQRCRLRRGINATTFQTSERLENIRPSVLWTQFRNGRDLQGRN